MKVGKSYDVEGHCIKIMEHSLKTLFISRVGKVAAENITCKINLFVEMKWIPSISGETMVGVFLEHTFFSFHMKV